MRRIALVPNLPLERRCSQALDKPTGAFAAINIVSLTAIDSARQRTRIRRGLGPISAWKQGHKCCWQVEFFFKWIQRRLRSKAFFGTGGNVVKTQTWIAVSVYVRVASAIAGGWKGAFTTFYRLTTEALAATNCFCSTSSRTLVCLGRWSSSCAFRPLASFYCRGSQRSKRINRNSVTSDQKLSRKANRRYL